MGAVKKSKVNSWAEELFYSAFDVETATGAPGERSKYDPEREHRFDAERLWRFDFAWPDYKIAVEIEGQGRHQTVDGQRKDCEKYNRATVLGWRVLRYMATDRNDASLWAREVADLMVSLDTE